MYKINDSAVWMIRNPLKRPSRFYISILMLMIGLGWLWSGPGGLDGNPQAALAASDPVIAAAGDIACDPASSGFNGGNGVLTRCRQKYTVACTRDGHIENASCFFGITLIVSMPD